MIATLIVLGMLLGLINGDPGFVDPYSHGPNEVTNHVFLSKDIEGLDADVNVWTPMTSGIYPVLYFLNGMAMAIPAYTCSDLLGHIASHGFVVVTPWVVSSMKPSEKVPYFTSVLEWAESNMEDLLHDNGVPVDVSFDFQTLLATSHSAGGHVIVSYLQETCGNFKGLALMSPVDGSDPFGIVHDFCITPGEYLNFSIPTLHMSAGYDPKPGFTGVACAPSKLSNERFWEALNPNSQRWSVNATEFAHADLLDDTYRVLLDESHFCAFNEQLSEVEYPTYRHFVGGTVVAFFKAMMEEDYEDYLRYLEDPRVMSVTALERHINPTGGRPSPSCSREPLQ